MEKLKGCYTALITPFRNGKIDEDAFRKLIDFQIKEGIDGLLVAGSTGEASSLSQNEYFNLIKICTETVRERVPVICGSGTNSTEKSVDMIRELSQFKINGILVIVPYYNKPTQQGMIEHFSRICENTDIPIIVYNIPGRTGINMLPSTLKKIREKCPGVIGVKEASGNLDQVSEIVRIMDENFSVMSGDDSLTLPMMSVGAKGSISVVSNILPGQTSCMCKLFAEGKHKEALEIHKELFPLIKALFIETNPIPVKYATHLMGFCEPSLRLPLTELSNEHRSALKKAMINTGIAL